MVATDTSLHGFVFCPTYNVYTWSFDMKIFSLFLLALFVFAPAPAEREKKVVKGSEQLKNNLRKSVISYVGAGNQASTGKEGGWAISGWWIALIGTLVGVAALFL
jgi:hypothetical protein